MNKEIKIAITIKVDAEDRLKCGEKCQGYFDGCKKIINYIMEDGTYRFRSPACLAAEKEVLK